MLPNVMSFRNFNWDGEMKRIFEYPNSSFDRCFLILSNWVSAIWHCMALPQAKFDKQKQKQQSLQTNKTGQPLKMQRLSEMLLI